MSSEKLDLIEKVLKSKNIEEYEIYLVERAIFETIFLKNKTENEREISDFDYFIRTLNQKENQTGIGVVKGNSLDPLQIERIIDTSLLLSRNNSSSKYYFPGNAQIPSIKTADKKVLNDPLAIKKDLAEELIGEASSQDEASTTFGRFRIHINNSFLRNCNDLNLNAQKTFFFVEFALKAKADGKLSEFWDNGYYKEKEHLKFNERISNWARRAKDTLRAEIPKAESSAVVIFSPSVLKYALTPVIGLHSIGKAHTEKISQFNIGDKVASDNISLIDDGLLEGGLSSNSWDSEGNPQQITEVLKNGLFQNRLYDQKYAILDGVQSTGNAKRAESGTVVNGISNFKIPPGDISLEEMISNIKEGYYIEQFSWLHPDEMSGNFGAEIRNGYYIKNGEFQNPIKLGNVSGNVLEMVKNCMYISKEREFNENTLFPYMVFKNLTVSS
ncbi:MAG: TldD/PmbA family protein [Candidatus Lokiarchaeota archaeon]|jgi:PmbA protein|nr:TldD/PmbA family protein [Candidatus Lokiarchaeota archaeon]